MHKKKTKWIIPEKISAKYKRELEAYPNLIQQFLSNRGINIAEEADAYLRANTPEYDPFCLKDLDLAVEIISKAIKEKKKIIVFGDYDVDGVTSSVLLVQVFERYQADVEFFIPNRFDEGYGLSSDALKRVLTKNPDLIITVDCGVRSVNEVADAREQGVDVIITDHHQPFDILPEANALICPKQPEDKYPYKYLAGVGIAYKLAQGLLRKYPIPNVQVEDWIDLVTVGTIADLAPLDGENRTLVRKGLRSIRLGKNKGLLALANVSRTNINQIRSEDIGFRIGPRLNAAGRLGSADLAFRVLSAKTTKEAGALALELDQLNRDRQQITRDIQAKAETMYDPEKHGQFMFFWDEQFHEGVMGLAASKLVDTYYRPAIVGVKNGNIVRASCRSIAELNITKALDECEQHLIQHGGHAMAAGLTIDINEIDVFVAALSAVCTREFSGKELVKTYKAEAEVSFEELHPENLDYYQLLEPLGNKNPPPLFVSRNISVSSIRKIGREGEHLRLQLVDKKMGFSAIAFRFGEYYDGIKQAEKLDILYAYEINEYNGRKSLQLRIVDFDFSGDKSVL